MTTDTLHETAAPPRNEPSAAAEPATPRPATPDTIYVDAKNIWITDDGLLRDEGTLFGLASADTTDKVAAIRNYYNDLKMDAEARLQRAQAVLMALLAQQQKREADLQKAMADEKVSGATPKPAPATHLFRNLLGLLLICGAAVGNFFLIHHFVTPAFGIATSAGVFLFGLFSLIAPVSAWLQTEEVNNGLFSRLKSGLLEVGAPIATTVFVAYLAYRQTGNTGFTIVTGFFLLFLFFFCGKLLLGVFYHLMHDIADWRLHIAGKQSRAAADKAKKEAIATWQAEIKEKAAAIETLQNEITTIASQSLSFAQQANLKVNLFLSEYQLAKQYSTTTNL